MGVMQFSSITDERKERYRFSKSKKGKRIYLLTTM